MPSALRSVAMMAAATALALAAPLAANAAEPYPPATQTDWHSTACAGATFTRTLPSGTFGGTSTLLESVTGAGAATPAAGMFVAAQTGYALTSTASGSATIKLKFPASATGAYNVSIAEQGAEKVSSGVVTVNAPGTGACAVDPAGVSAAAASSDPAAAASTASLARTGTSIDAGVVWFGLGAVIIGSCLAFLAGRRRRLRDR